MFNPYSLPISCDNTWSMPSFRKSLKCCLTCNDSKIRHAIRYGNYNIIGDSAHIANLNSNCKLTNIEQMRELMKFGYLDTTINKCFEEAVYPENRFEVFKELFNVEGVNPNYDNGKYAVINNLMHHGGDTIKVLKLFFDRGANPNLVGSDGYTPLKTACVIQDWNSRGRNKSEIINFLLENGADFDSSGINIQNAINSECVDFVNRLIEKGVDLSSDNYFINPLSSAIYKGNLEIIKTLLLNGANWNLDFETIYYSKFLHKPECKEIVDFPSLMLLYCFEQNGIQLDPDTTCELVDLIYENLKANKRKIQTDNQEHYIGRNHAVFDDDEGI